MMNTAPPTRHARVIAILDAAAAGSSADYGGIGPFWRLPVSRLIELQLHGVPMIAQKPKSASSCCASEPAEGARGRGASSGLVLGLRGLAPFDGVRLPRLPWGGQPVSEEDIRFISDWIDDGCPSEDREIAEIALSLDAADSPVVESAQGWAVSDEGWLGRPGDVRQRMNLDCMSEGQVDQLRRAFRELFRLNKWPEDKRSYNNIALIHQNHCQHGWERFLPWHRVYLYELEQNLQDVVPGVSLPYWDFTMPQYEPAQPEKGWIIPPSYKARLTDASLLYLMRADPPLPPEQAEVLRAGIVAKGTLYTSLGAFLADVSALIGAEYTVGAHRRRFIDALLDANALWYPLRYPAEYGGGTINTVIHYHYPTADDIAQIMSLRSFRDFGGGSLYNDSFGFMDQNPHNTMHIWTGGMNPNYKSGSIAQAAEDARVGLNRNRGVQVVGRRFHTRADMYTEPQFGDMFSNLTASYDPIFWPIHVNVDRLWWEWQQVNPHALPADLDSVLTPWSYTIADTLDIAPFGYEYVRSTSRIPVGLGEPLPRFVSRPVELSDAVRSTYRQVEVRLHRVPQLQRSCFIRVFLNLPDANASTPLDHPNYAGYLAVFGHGPCIGGPGHCEIPSRQARPYDLRPRDHNTPRNHRVNVTRTARRLLDAGASALQLTLVVIGADYQEDRELLRLEGVSLNFLD